MGAEGVAVVTLPNQSKEAPAADLKAQHGKGAKSQPTLDTEVRESPGMIAKYLVKLAVRNFRKLRQRPTQIPTTVTAG